MGQSWVRVGLCVVGPFAAFAWALCRLGNAQCGLPRVTVVRKRLRGCLICCPHGVDVGYFGWHVALSSLLSTTQCTFKTTKSTWHWPPSGFLLGSLHKGILVYKDHRVVGGKTHGLEQGRVGGQGAALQGSPLSWHIVDTTSWTADRAEWKTLPFRHHVDVPLEHHPAGHHGCVET